MARQVWFRVTAVLVLFAAAALVWTTTAQPASAVRDFPDWLTQHRQAWYALPAVITAFVVLGLGLVPVLLLIAATGVAFGPVLGPIYAMAGCLTSASVGFAIGRWVGMRRVEALGGDRIVRMTRALRRNGTLAVFLLRKVPAPFTLSNIVAGASTVRYRDFIFGTMLGMGAAVIALAGFGHQLTQIWRARSHRR